MARGRKRQSGPREPNGRPSRKQEHRTARILDGLARDERDTMSVAVEARERVHGIDQKFLNSMPKPDGQPAPSHAAVLRDQMAGSFIGRLCLTGQVTVVQYDAAMKWLEDVHNYQRAVSPAIGKQPGAIDLNRTQGSSVDAENVTRTRKWVKRYTDATKAIQAVQNELRGNGALFAALNHVVQRDLELLHMVGDCRTALNALARHYGLAGSRAPRKAPEEELV